MSLHELPLFQALEEGGRGNQLGHSSVSIPVHWHASPFTSEARTLCPSPRVCSRKRIEPCFQVSQPDPVEKGLVAWIVPERVG